MKKLITILLLFICSFAAGQTFNSNVQFNKSVRFRGFTNAYDTMFYWIKGVDTCRIGFKNGYFTVECGASVDSIYGFGSGGGGGVTTVPRPPLKGLQYDSAGAFGANANLMYDYTNGRLGLGLNGTAPTETFHVQRTSINSNNQLALFSSPSNAFSYLGVKSAAQNITWGISDDITLYDSPFFIFNTATSKFPVMVSHANDGNGSMVIGSGSQGGNMAPAYFQNHTLELMPKGNDGAQLVFNSNAIGGGSWAQTVNGTGSPYGAPYSMLLFNESTSLLTSGRIAILDTTGFMIGRKAYNDPNNKAKALMHLRNYFKTDTLIIAEDSAGLRALTVTGSGDVYLPRLAVGSASDSSVVWNPTTKKLGYYIKPGGSGGGGTVTSFSAGTASPYFTTSVATATTTPALTFNISNAGAGTILNNPNTSSAAPSFISTPQLGNPGVSSGTLTFASSGGGTISIQAATTLSANYGIAFPATAGADGQKLQYVSSNSTMIWTKDTTSIGVIFDGGASVIDTGITYYVRIPESCTIIKATMLSDVSTTSTVQVWKDTYANYPPVLADKIYNATPPTATAATKSEDTTLSGWTTYLEKGDVIAFHISANNNSMVLTIQLDCVK